MSLNIVCHRRCVYHAIKCVICMTLNVIQKPLENIQQKKKNDKNIIADSASFKQLPAVII